MDENKKTYPLSWVVMQNNVQECFKSMNIDEKRMLILASPIARTTDATEKDPKRWSHLFEQLKAYL